MTGHALAATAADNEVERAYIKTVEESFWIVRATGELSVDPGSLLRLRFVRQGDVYSIWNDETLIVTYYRAGGYPAGPLLNRAVLRMLQANGWTEVARRGSHRQFKHQSKPGRVTVPGKPSDDLAPGTLNSILKQADLKNE